MLRLKIKRGPVVIELETDIQFAMTSTFQSVAADMLEKLATKIQTLSEEKTDK